YGSVGKADERREPRGRAAESRRVAKQHRRHVGRARLPISPQRECSRPMAAQGPGKQVHREVRGCGTATWCGDGDGETVKAWRGENPFTTKDTKVSQRARRMR